jgi:hypothetical protein
MFVKLGIRLFGRVSIGSLRIKQKITKEKESALASKDTDEEASMPLVDTHDIPKTKVSQAYEELRKYKMLVPDEELIADSSLGQYNIPLEICTPAKRVFSKHDTVGVRIWGKELDLLYRKIWCSEKPSILTGVPNFANDISFHGRNSQTGIKETDIEPENKIHKKRRQLYDKDQQTMFTYERSHAVAYLKNRMPRTYFANKRILRELKQRIPFFQPKAVLDYGAGLGSAIWAAVDTYKSIDRAVAVEPSPNMRALGKFLTKELKTEILWLEALSMMPALGNQTGIC